MTSRPALIVVAALVLGACSGEAPRPAPPAALPEATPPGGATEVEGSWVYCSGDGDLDEEVVFEGGEARTYLHHRPGTSGAFTLDGTTFEWAGGPSAGRRLEIERAGDALVVRGPSGETLYTRHGTPCPDGSPGGWENLPEE